MTGQETIGAARSDLGPDRRYAAIAKSILYKIGIERKTVTLLHQKVLSRKFVERTGCSIFRTVETAVGCCLRGYAHESTRHLAYRHHQFWEDWRRLPVNMVCRDGRRHKGFSHRLGVNACCMDQPNLARRAQTWAQGLNIHDVYDFGSLEVFQPGSDKRSNLRELYSGLILISQN